MRGETAHPPSLGAEAGRGPRQAAALGCRAPPRTRSRSPGYRGRVDAIRGVVITVSDRCSRGEADDRSGPLAAELLAAAGVQAEVVVIPDGASSVTGAVREALAAGARVVVTTGGTGVAPRDRTPEGTAEVLEQELPGLAEAIRARGSASVPTAVLSRGLAGVASGAGGPAVVVNAPGSTGGVRDTIAVLTPLLGHLLSQLDGGDH